ncbi:MAG: geranylgeranylglyceryl/heptaprenylglyceryl phosphate synthase [Desulfurococcaceae archaeon]
MGKVEDYIRSRLASGEKLHFTLIDPDKSIDPSMLEKTADLAKSYGTDAFLIGGSLGVTPGEADETAKILRKTGVPVIVFPGNINCLTRFADAVLYMVLMNSIDRYYVMEAQVQAAPIIWKYGLETLPTGYIVVYSDTAVAHVGKAYPLPEGKPELVAAYALAAEMMGLRYLYLEAGSGSNRIVPPLYLRIVKKYTKLVLIVGGGIRKPEHARVLAENGADIIVTGTIVEEDSESLLSIIKAIKSV